MKKKLLTLAMTLGLCAVPFSQSRAGVLCTIVISPCDGVPNTLFEGEATEAQIREAYNKMKKQCDDMDDHEQTTPPQGE